MQQSKWTWTQLHRCVVIVPSNYLFQLFLFESTVEVTVKGPIDSTTGMVMNLADLKSFISRTVMDVLDHKNIDKDVPYFNNVVSTTENLAVFVWNQLSPLITGPCQLFEVKIYETDKNIMVYRGEMET